MKLAYADPPYPGQAKRKYGEHKDYAGEVDHRELIERLEAEYDGWALSTSAQALHEILPLCPAVGPGIKGRRYRSNTGTRVLSWVKPSAGPFPNCGIYGWEPVLVRRPRERDIPAALRDVLICSADSYTFRRKPDNHLPGAKPAAFCRWVFDWLGAGPDDTLDDLFLGTGAVTEAWDAFTAQTRLAVA